MPRIRILLAILPAIFAIATLAHADTPRFPKLTGRVVDDAGILSPATKSTITSESADHERFSGEQVVVVTIKSLQGYSIEDFGYQLGRDWGIGQASRNNGVLLIVAPNERKVRIEVGYGLEGTLTDAESRIIIEQSIIPAFRRRDFNSGVLDGFNAILRTLSGNPVQAQPSPTPIPFWSFPPGVAIVFIWCILFFGPWFFFLTMWFRHRNDPPDYASYRGGSSRSGWSSGSSFGGGSDSGGFSGGGGSFGGGGASGSW